MGLHRRLTHRRLHRPGILRSSDDVLSLLQQHILTDNGEEFLAYKFENYLRQFGIKHLRISPYHPQTNGRFEKFNDNLVQMLALLAAQTASTAGMGTYRTLYWHTAHTSTAARAHLPGTSPTVESFAPRARPSSPTHRCGDRAPAAISS